MRRQPRRISRLRTVIVIACFALTGCGLTQTRGPDRHRPADQRPECTESFAAPKRDAIGALAGLIALLVGIPVYKVGDRETAGAALMIGGGALMAGSYLSGGIGYYRVKRCREAIREYQAGSAAARP